MNDVPTLLRHKLQITQFHQMRVAGIFRSEDRIELLEGELIDMPPIGPAHSGKTNQLSRLLLQAVGNTAIVSVQNPVMLSEDSESQPDLAILRWREDFYATTHPQPQDILLIVEIADTTASVDRTYKIPLYAQYNIPEVWLLDLQKRQLEIYRQPEADHYRYILIPKRDETVDLLLLPNITLELKAMW
ncbi:MAG: Uma2 family endonuclease [Thioploca sp.]|nr:Uma2 family endonuclease [Thioploca sp.]